MAKTGPSEWTLYMKKVEHFLIHGGYSDTTATHEKSNGTVLEHPEYGTLLLPEFACKWYGVGAP